jgi:ABC-2 type transport system permease protein
MLHRVAALIVKELLAILRDPRGRLVLIVPPFVQLLVFANAATLEVSNVELAVLDRDGGAHAHELVARIEASPRFSHVLHLATLAEVHEAIVMRRVIGAVHLSPRFSRDLAAHKPADLQLILDGRRENAAQIVAGYLTQITEGMISEGPSGAAVRAQSRLPVLVVRNWFNPSLEFQWHTVPGLVAIISLLIGLIVTALSVARERELGTFDQLMVSPLRTHEILLGKTVPPLLVGLFHTTVFVLAAVYVFGVPLRGSLLLLYGSALFYLAALIGIGLFISALSSTQQQAILGAFLFATPAILLSGFATPLENMPGWLQTVTLVNPLRWFLVIVKGVFLKALPLSEVLRNVLPLALIATVTLSSAAWLFRHRKE